MSLINDALKRAKQTQQQNPPPTPPLQFRPVEPGQSNHARTALWFVGLALALILVVALVGVFVWFLSQKSAGELRAAARTINEPAGAAPADSRVEPVPSSSAAVAPVETGTNPPAITAAVEPPKTMEPKLQGISFHPTRPLAVVNDRTVVIGDRVGGFRVVAITRNSVTLISAAATNVLSLSE
jgi:hypothetical protein